VPTLADVAALAEVSTATVSRCLNTPQLVGAETRARVMAAVKSLGYAPNFSARALAAKRTGTVGAVIPTMENAIFARAIQAFQEELAGHGITLLIASSSFNPAREEDQIRTLVARGADALLLIGYDRSAEIYDFLHSRGVPTLIAWSFDPGRAHPAIGFDNAAAMAALAHRALEMGHRHIGFVSAHTAGNDRARGRLDGVRAAMISAGLEPEGLTLIETDYGIDTGATAFHRIMARAPDTTVVLCGNDVLAIGAMRGAEALGLTVPDDVSITGFDDIELATLARPALTTVHVPHREMGRRAAGMLLGMIGSELVPASVALHTDIMMRESLAPPRRA
jgi:LacI family transcriptional regulator